MSHVWDVLQDVDYRTGGNASLFPQTGLTVDHWTDGGEFTINLGTLPRRHARMLRIDAAPMGQQSFSVHAHGELAGSHVAAKDFVVAIALPPPPAEGSADLVLRFVMDAPRRPVDIGLSEDTRDLGLFLHRLTVLGAADPPPAHWPGHRLGPNVDCNGRNLVGHFESLGDNCELGFVQKKLGLHSSSLLRYTATPFKRLLAGVSTGFVGVADPDGLTLVLDGPPGKVEYQIRLARYGLHYHTLIFTHEADAETVLSQERQKLERKHQKFLATLGRADRILVVKSSAGLLEGEVTALWLALQRYGPNSLLWVREADDPAQVGKISVLRPGLMQSFVTKFADLSDATQGSIPEWLAICRGALRVWTS